MKTDLETAKLDCKLKIELIENIDKYHKIFTIEKIIEIINELLFRTKLNNEADCSSVIHDILKFTYGYVENYFV